MTDLTILVPTRNRPKLLWRALGNLAEQGSPTCEIVVLVLDNSDNPDPGALVVGDIEETEPEHVSFRYQRVWPPGHANALNAGYPLADSPYIGWADDDDTWKPGAFGLMIDYLRRHPDVDAVYGSHERLREDLAQPGQAPPRVFEPSLPASLLPQYSVVWFPVMRAEVMRELDGLDGRWWPADDYDFWLRAHLSGFTIANIPAVTLEYHWHGANVSVKQRQRQEMLAILIQARARAWTEAGMFFTWKARFDPPGFRFEIPE